MEISTLREKKNICQLCIFNEHLNTFNQIRHNLIGLLANYLQD